MPNPNINPEMLYLKPCENLCALFSFRENIDLVDWGGVCRLYEEATIYEIADKTGTTIRQVRSRYRRRRD